jgi:hypothetical protein
VSRGTVHQRLVERALTGKYGLFLGVGGGCAALGFILFIMALSGEDAVRAWQLFHVNWLYFTGLAGGSVAFAAVQKITNAKWSGLMIRFAEASVAFLPLSLLGLVLIFTLGYDAIYGPMVVAAHGMDHAKEVWLSRPFMFGRLAVGLTLLYWVGWKLIRADLIPDMLATRAVAGPGRRSLFDRWTRGYDGTPPSARALEDRIHRLAPLYAVLYAIVFSMVAFDGIMALQPHWFSNLLGGFYFMGSFLGAHMLLGLMAMYGAAHLGIADLVSPKQRHDLGKLCFGFTVFWTYLMWAQFLVIWYGNLPEETGFVYARLWGSWRPVGTAVGIGMFIIPFFGLLGVAPKKIRPVFAFFAIVSLLALWLERYLLVLPSISPLSGPTFETPEAGATLLFLGLYLLAYALFARSFPMVSPRLAEITLDRERGHAVMAAEFDHEESPADYVSPELIERRENPRG